MKMENGVFSMLRIGWIIIFWVDHQANVLNLCCYRILQSHGSQTSPLPHFSFSQYFLKFKLNLSLSKYIASPSSPFRRASSIWGFNPIKDGYKKSPGLFMGLAWAWEEWRVKDAGFENAFSNVNPSHHRHSIASHRPSSVVAFYAKSQVGWARGPGTKMTLDMSQQQVQWEGSLASPRRPDRAAARGLWRLKGFCIVCFQSCAFSLECCFCSAGWVGVGVWMLLFAVF